MLICKQQELFYLLHGPVAHVIGKITLIASKSSMKASNWPTLRANLLKSRANTSSLRSHLQALLLILANNGGTAPMLLLKYLTLS